MKEDNPKDRQMVESLAIIDLDPSLSLFKPVQQKWISSLQFVSETPKEPFINGKVLAISSSLYLLIGFCQKNKPPIYQIDFLTQPSQQWMNVRLSQQYSSVGMFCYKCQEVQLSGPLTDIDILVVQKMKIFGENQEIATVPPGYHMLNTPIGNTYLTYRKMRGKIQQTYKPLLVQKYPEENKSINLSSLPIFCFPEGIRLSRQLKGFVTVNFILTIETAERIYCTCLIFKESLSEAHKSKLNIKTNQKIYYEKAMCIVSKYCYTEQFSQCLQHLYRLSMSKSQLPFYKIAQNFVDKLQMTKQIGNLGVSYSYGGSNIIFKTNKLYPNVSEKAIYCLFKFLSTDIIMSVFEAILLQRKIIFVSQSKTVLGYATQAFISFIFPFKWEQVLIPILPVTLKDYLHAPVPLIAGTSPILIDHTIQSQSIIVFLDRNQIVNQQTLPPLPEKMQKQLIKRLSEFQIYVQEQVKQYLDNPQNTYIFKMQQVENPHFKGHLIRDIFFEFMLTFMKNYRKYWIKKNNDFKDQTSIGFSTQPQLINEMFKTQDFLSDLNMYKVGSFGYKFTQSSIFTAFMERRYQNPEDPQISYFDECLTIKKNKKESILINYIQNDKYSVCQHPLIQNNGKSVYVYDKFPSILAPMMGMKEQEIYIQIGQLHQQEERIIQFIEDEESANFHFYQSGILKLQNQLYDRMARILLKRYKAQFPFGETNKLFVLRWFMEVYIKQLTEIQKFFQHWIDLQPKMKFITIKKQDYIQGLNQQQKLQKGEILGVCSNGDFQMLICEQKRLLITPSRSSYLKKQNTLYIQVPSFQIKCHLNRIIPRQALWLFQFLESNRNYPQWSIQNLIDFHEWIISNHSQ